MRAIIIQDEDARALLDALELNKLRGVPGFGLNLDQRYSDEELKKWLTEEIHRSFHFVVCRWLQDHGAQVTR